MQNIHSQDTSYLGGGNGGYASYEDGHRRMTDFRSHRGSDASSQRARQQAYPPGNLIPVPPPHAYAHSGRSVESSPDRGYSPARSYRDDRSPSPGKRPIPPQPYLHSYSSTNNLLGAAAGPGVAIPMHDRPSSRVSNQAGYLGARPASYYHDNASDAGSAYSPSVLTPNNAASAGLGTIDPMEILDDDVDDPILNSKKPARGYKGGEMGMGTSTAGLYNSIPGGGLGPEKDFAARYARQPPKRKSTGWKLLFWGIPVLIVIGIIAGVVGFVLHENDLNNKDLGPQGGTFNSLIGSGSGSNTDNNTSSTPSSSTGSDLTKDSPEIIALLNDATLHKVFPGIDYTPQNTQWPACLSSPPNQDNVTMDIAIISQLAPVVRLYGTDCNQTEMVLHAISALGLNDTLKLWAAVWLENNATTNARQLKQMYDILDTHGTDNLNGIIIGNEVLFREDLTETQLIANITEFRTNITNLYPSSGLKIATSDLGSSWNAQLAEAVDVVMSNIHPFFGGVPAAQAASWTYSFFQNNDVPVTQGMTGKSQIIAETGWPSGGGNDCGSGNTCASDTDGAVAGVEGMNLFLEEWVCQALENGTNYFW
jgi:exo-beta-1,3-glucanase (GH17 family)